MAPMATIESTGFVKLLVAPMLHTKFQLIPASCSGEKVIDFQDGYYDNHIG